MNLKLIPARLRADLTLLLVTIFWGSAFAVLRIALEHQVVFYLNGLRLTVGALLLLPLAWRSGEPIRREHLGPILLTGFILFGAVALQMIGLSQTTAGNAGFITSLYVVIVPFILFLRWGEKPSTFLLLAVALAALGGYLLSTNGGTLQFSVGDMWVFGSSFFWAMHVVVIGRIANRMPPLIYAAGQFGVAGLLNMLVGLFLERPAPEAFLAIAPSVIYTGIFSIALGFTLQVMAQKHTPAGDAALILSLESVFAAFFGWWWVGEILLPLQLLGCGLILVAVVIAQARDLLPHPPA